MDAGSAAAQLAITQFYPKAKGKSAGGSSDKLKEQKRTAEARNRRLAKSPEHVRVTWNEICNLKGRDRSNTVAKAQFTSMIINDTKFEDVYWETSVNDQYKPEQ